jgi:hypothetical protein
MPFDRISVWWIAGATMYQTLVCTVLVLIMFLVQIAMIQSQFLAILDSITQF